MIDKTSGAFVLDSGALFEPTILFDDFAKSLLGKRSNVDAQSTHQWRVCTVKNCLSQGISWGVELTFKENRLFSLRLWHENGPGPTSWNDWHMDKLVAVKEEHDAFVTSWLGPRPWEFPWGTVSSGIDERGGSAVLMIRYA